MRGKPIKKSEIMRIMNLRQTGHSLPEICKALNRGGSTVYKYAKDVIVLPEYKNSLRSKQGGSKKRSKEHWEKSAIDAKELLGNISKRDKLFLLTALYWGEGTKNGFDIINGDPSMIRIIISCLHDLGVSKSDLRVSLRIYDDIPALKARKYWAGICDISTDDILSVNVLPGKKIGKLTYGMCRIRISNSGKYFKLIMSMISFVKSEIV